MILVWVKNYELAEFPGFSFRRFRVIFKAYEISH